MRVEFHDRQNLEESLATGRNRSRLGHPVFRKFLEAIRLLRVIEDESELYLFKGLHFERLSGDREGQCSIRLNRQFRLVFTIGEDDDGKKILIIEVVDYH